MLLALGLSRGSDLHKLPSFMAAWGLVRLAVDQVAIIQPDAINDESQRAIWRTSPAPAVASNYGHQPLVDYDAWTTYN
jgi:hypothetical protein